MQIDQRIPDLSDKELETLRANALRLAGSGTTQQQQQAESLLPLLEAALSERRAARALANPAKLAKAKKAKAAKPAKAAAAP